MDWQKSILQKDNIYYFKYRGFEGIVTINNHIFDNSIQINIKFTFIVHEYMIVYKYISYYPIIQFDIYVYVYIYIRHICIYIVVYI